MTDTNAEPTIVKEFTRAISRAIDDVARQYAGHVDDLHVFSALVAIGADIIMKLDDDGLRAVADAFNADYHEALAMVVANMDAAHPTT